jgi:RND family efflux transporter MFP subunit
VKRVIVSLTLGAVVTISGCGKATHATRQPGAELPAVNVRTVIAKTALDAAVEEIPGTLRAVERASIAAKVSGRIQEMPVALGQALKKGDLIAVIDAPEATARLEQASANLEQASRDAKRVTALFQQQVATRAEVDAVEARLRVAQGAVDEARAALQNATLVAPFAGLVTRKFAEPGDLAQPGRQLVDLENPARLEVQADLPEAIAGQLQPGAELGVLLGTNTLTGKVRELSPSADPQTRTFQLKLAIETQGRIMPGQFARVLVPLGHREVIRVPQSAVVQRGQLEIVFVVETNRARMHLVKTGRSTGGELEILSGLDGGDAVVVEKASLLTDGQPVTVQ